MKIKNSFVTDTVKPITSKINRILKKKIKIYFLEVYNGIHG